MKPVAGRGREAATPPSAFLCFLFVRQCGCKIHKDVADKRGYTPQPCCVFLHATMPLQNPQGCDRQARLHPPSLVVFFVHATMPLQNSQGCDRETRLHPLWVVVVRGQPCCHFRHTNFYFAKNTTRLGVRFQLGQLSGASLVVIFDIRILNLQKTQQGWRVRSLTGRLSGGKDVYA